MTVIERNISVHRHRNTYVLFQKTYKKYRMQCECVSIAQAKQLKNFVTDVICTYDDPKKVKCVVDSYIETQIKPALVLDRCQPCVS